MGGGKILLLDCRKHFFTYLRNIVKLVQKEHIDVIHCHFDTKNRLAVALLSMLFPHKKYFLTIHCEPRNANIAKRLLYNFMHSRFDKVLPVSQGVLHGMEKIYGKHKNHQVLYMGVRKRALGNSNLRPSLGIDPDTVVVTNVGFDINIKGIDILVESVRRIVERHATPLNFKVMVVGIDKAREEHNKLMELIRAAHVENYFICTGIRNDVDDLLHISDIYTQPSRTEAISLTIMEACTHSLPIVATQVGGVPEVVHDGENGFLVPKEDAAALADKLEQLILSKPLRQSMGKASAALAPKFDLTQNASKLVKLYHSKKNDLI